MMEQPLVGPLLMLLLLGVVVRPVLQKKTARSSVTARASTQMRSINPTGGGPAKPARTSSPFNQQEWLDHHYGKQNQGSGEDVVRICGCGKNVGNGSGANADDAKKHEESEQHTL